MIYRFHLTNSKTQLHDIIIGAHNIEEALGYFLSYTKHIIKTISIVQNADICVFMRIETADYIVYYDIHESPYHSGVIM